jgi:protocatechuate 3,4-dioxygenase beta subunit
VIGGTVPSVEGSMAKLGTVLAYLAISAVAVALTSLPALSAPPLSPTPRLAEGPYYPSAKPKETDNDLTRIGKGPGARGRTLTLRGRVLDINGNPAPGTRIEIWQADFRGIHMHPRDRRTEQRDRNFQFYGVAIADPKGSFVFRTILPGLYGGRPRHVHARITPPRGATFSTQFYIKTGATLRRDGILRLLGRSAQRITLTTRRTAGPRSPLEAPMTIVLPPQRRR